MAMTGFAKVLTGLIVVGAVGFGIHTAKEKGMLGEKTTASAVPTRADLPSTQDSHGPSGNVAVTLPGSAPAAATGPCINRDIWAWNAQMGEILANGGKVTKQGSLMAKRGLCVHLNRQDDTGKNQENLIKFATVLASGNPQPQEGATFVGIMGDGAGQFMAAIKPTLDKLGPEYGAKIVASFGFSRGEDAFMAPPECANAQTKAERQEHCKGLLISGVLKDGDWNIPMKFAGDNDIRNNPVEGTYDPDAINWVNSKDYIEAGEKYIAGFCDNFDVVKNGHKTGDKQKVCVNGVVTWTPGDVNVAKKKGGLAKVVSTKQYSMQMPMVLIGIDKWMKDNRSTVVNYVAAALEGGNQILASEAALDRAAVASQDVYGEEDPAYWKRYYKGVNEADMTGLRIDLGGSKVNNLADNLKLFGLTSGYANALAATYTTFGKIVMQQYPKDVTSIPPINEVLDTSYLQAVAKDAPATQAETIVYHEPTSLTGEISSKSWHINFKTGSAAFTGDSQAQLEQMARDLVIAGNTVIEIQGHTDNQGTDAKNNALSEARARAVKAWLQSKASGNFPDSRVTVAAYGAAKPVASNANATGRAQNRRVEVRILRN